MHPNSWQQWLIEQQHSLMNSHTQFTLHSCAAKLNEAHLCGAKQELSLLLMRKAVQSLPSEAASVSCAALYPKPTPKVQPWCSPLGLAAQATGTGALLQHSIRLQLPADQVQQPVGRVVAGLPFLRQGCAHREQQLCRPRKGISEKPSAVCPVFNSACRL